jgi:putative redox protein
MPADASFAGGRGGSQMHLKLKQTGPRKMEVISDNWSFVVDLKEKFGGEDSGPNPSELTAAAVASCEVLTGIVWAARRHEIELRDLEAEVTWEYEENPDRISRIDVAIKNVSDQLGEKKRAFAAIAKGCTVSKTFKIQPQLSLKVE